MRSWRQRFYSMGPAWQVGVSGSGDESERLYYSMSLLFDMFLERAFQAAKVRFPKYAPDDALAYLGRDRRIRRGINEPAAAYASRLIRYLDDHLTQGNPFALMDQVYAYMQMPSLILRTVDRRGNWMLREADGTRSYLLNTGNWEWDVGALTSWGKYWLVMYNTTWTQGAFGEVVAPADEIAGLRAVIREWKPAGMTPQWVIVAFDNDSFSPAQPEPSDGNHLNWQTYSNYLDFDGSDDVVTHGNVAAMQFEYDDDWTLSVWFCTSASAGVQTIFCKRGASSPWVGYALTLQASGEIRVILKAAASALTLEGPVLNDGSWHHAAVRVTYPGAGFPGPSDVSLCIDGAEVSLSTITDSLAGTILSASNVSVGATYAVPGTIYEPFAGQLTNYAAWYEALSDSDMLDVFARGLAGDVSNIGAPVLRCPVGGSTYPTIVDAVGGENGTMTNMTTGDLIEHAVPGRVSTARYLGAVET